MTVSLSLIVRDAAATLARCLESARAHVDEIVVIDTGSTDNTVEIAERYADRVGFFEWCDDFSAARQYALEACTGDWVCWLDADDSLHGGEHIRPSCAAADESTGAIMWRYVVGWASNGEPSLQFWRERAVRRGMAHWIGRAHEYLRIDPPLVGKRDDRIWVDHHGHGDDAGSMRRNVRILEAELASQDPPQARTLFYLARDLIWGKEHDRALQLLEQYLPLSTWTDEQYLAQLMVGYCYRLKADYQNALGEDLAALLIKHDWPDAYYAIAEDYYYLHEWSRVKYWSELGQRLAPPDTDMFVSPRAYAFGWMIYYSVALIELGLYSEAIALSQRALAIEPGDAQHRHNLHYAASRLVSQSQGQADQPESISSVDLQIAK